jgi:hypothetical protein
MEVRKEAFKKARANYKTGPPAEARPQAAGDFYVTISLEAQGAGIPDEQFIEMKEHLVRHAFFSLGLANMRFAAVDDKPQRATRATNHSDPCRQSLRLPPPIDLTGVSRSRALLAICGRLLPGSTSSVLANLSASNLDKKSRSADSPAAVHTFIPTYRMYYRPFTTSSNKSLVRAYNAR